MTTQQVEASVVAIVESTLKTAVSAHTLREDCPAWDSLKHIEVVFAVEDEFGISFTEGELSGLDGMPKLVTAVCRHLCVTTS